MLRAVIRHKTGKFAHGVGNVRSSARRKVHTFAHEGALRESVGDSLFGVILWAHVVCESPAGARRFNGIGMFYPEILEDGEYKLSLVNHK